MSSRWNPGWKKGKTLSLINGYIQLVQSLSSRTTADKMLSKGFHNNYFLMLNKECQDLLYGNEVLDLSSLSCTYKVQSLQCLKLQVFSMNYQLLRLQSSLIDSFDFFHLVPC